MNVVHLILLRDSDTFPAGQQFLHNDLPKIVLRITEIVILVFRDWIVFHPHNRFVEPVILLFEILQLQLMAQYHLIEGSREEGVD